jgi:two-component system, sensor histidine kinase and response regulator
MLMPPFDEVARLQALRDLAILDTAAEDSFDELTRTAALVCQMPIALISLVDEHRQWFKAKFGINAVETPREVAFCDHAIRRSHELLEVGDATKDPRFSANPLVTGAPDIRFYAGAPLVDANGHALGTLCVIDRRPRQLEPWQREVLGHLARQVVRLFAARSLAKSELSSSARAAVSTMAGLVRQVPSGAVAVGPHGRLQVNQAACAILGIPAAELPDLTTWFARLYGDRAAETRVLYDADRAAGFPDPRQVWVTRGDGERRLIEFHGVNTAQGEMWLLRDITDTVGAEERFRVLFEHSSDAHLLFDESGIIDCNQAAITLLRCTDKRQVLSLHPAKLSPEFQPDGRRSDEKCIEMDRLARERGHHRFEWQHRRMDGSDFPVEVTLTPVQLHGHTVLLVVWHDLTERKRAEESERQREHRWLLALEASGDGVWDWDLSSGRIFYSPRWKAMLGYADHEISDTIEEWESRVHPEDLQQAMSDVARHVAGEVPQYVNEHRIRCRDGSWKWILDRGMVVERRADGRPKRMIGTKGDLTERRNMEDALRLEQERFRAMNDASPVGIFVTDVAGRATYLNDRWSALTGLEHNRAMGDGWSATLHPDDRERVYAVWTRAVSDGTTFHAEYRFRHDDGSIIWCQGMAAPMRLGGQVVGYVGSIADITERHDAEDRLRDSLHRFDLVAAGAAIGIWETRFDPLHWREQITADLPFFWSRRFIDIIGYTPEEFPDRLEPWLQALHPDDRDRTLGAVFDCLGQGVPYNIEYRLRHKNGDYRWCHATGEAERDAQGRPFRMAGSMADISARKRDEEMLDLARTQLIDAIGNIDAGFAMFTADDHLVISNERFSGLYALDGMEMMPGAPYHDILTALVRGGVLNGSGLDEQAWISERCAAHVEVGPEREFLLAGRWIRIAERRTADGGIVSLHTDITVLKQAAEEMRMARDLAEKAASAKADFLATMSHELRTPMNGVIGMSSLLLDTPLNQQQKEFAETVRLCGDQLLALINDILDFSKIEAGSLALEQIPFSPRRLGEDAVALLADQAEKKGLQIVCLIGSDVPARLLGDPTRLRQVLLNLLGNAVKFTERGEVVLSITTNTPAAGPPTIELAVRDSGIGISAAARERLFKPFSQADSSTTRKYGGTGLGLVICMRLVQLMGGTIALDSVLGSGSTFTCRLPLLRAPDAELESGHDGLVGRQALVVGASPAARRALREQLIGWGMTCAECADVAGIAAAVAPARPAVVIIDHDLPGGGLTLSRQLAEQPATAGIPIVLLVAGAHRGMATTAKEAGIAGFLTKPVRHAQLFECLLVVLNQACRMGDPVRVAQPLLVTRHSLDEERAPRRVLVVEDNPVNRQVAVMMLNKLGCRCDIATNGQEAVEAVARQDYQVVFMDCQMPVMDGFAAATEIRRQEAGNRRVRIVALTANAMQGDRERCLTAGMDDYVSKPIKATDLEVALARTDQRKPAAAALVTPTSHEPVIDESALQGLLDATDQETLTAVAEMLRVDAGTSLTDLRQAASVGDAVSLGRTAHRLKGSSGTLGLRRVQELCQKLEQAGRARQIEQAGALVEALAAALAEALPALAAHRLVSSG